MKARLLWYAWSLLALSLTALLAFPIRTGILRLLILILAFAVWLGLVGLLWKRRRAVAIGILSVTAVLAAGLALPGREIPPDQLRARYLQALRAYDGTIYIWGGENSLGIDCSGLVRCAMADALFSQGVRTANPAALRAALRLWWRDQSAKGLTDPSNSVTQPARQATATTNLRDLTNIKAGDLAITATGSHVLAYLGDGEWIEAEPSVGHTHVFTLSGPFADVAAERVVFVRWKWLAAAGPD